MKPLVSIIIPCYNYAEYVGECLMSCIKQTYKDIEIIVIDDCSSDGSWEVISDIIDAHDPGKDFILGIRNKKNMGYSYCKNEAIIAASGKYIVHIDADDQLLSNSVVVRLSEFLEDPELEMVHGRAYRLRVRDDEWIVDSYNSNSKIHAQGVMVKRSVYEKYGLYYEPLRSRADKEMTYRWGVHPRSELPKLIKAKSIKKFVAYYRKHDRQMHKTRRANESVNKEIQRVFNNRIRQLKRQGITKENTRFI